MAAQFAIDLPEKLYLALKGQGIFDDAPPEVRAIFAAAVRLPFGNGQRYYMSGSRPQMDAVLVHLGALMDRIEEHGRRPPTAAQFGYGRLHLTKLLRQNMRERRRTPLRDIPLEITTITTN